MNAEGTDEPFRVAVLQAGTEHGAKGNPGPDANFALLAGRARLAAAERPDIVVFPEYAVTGWPYPREPEFRGAGGPVPGAGRWYVAFRDLARELGVALLANLAETDDAQRFFNTAVLLDERGEFRGKYRKVHANLGEQTWFGFAQGDTFAPLEYRGVKIGVSICSDMWCPETIRCAALLGADLILHQSIADDMGDIVPVRAKDSAIPVAMSIFNGGSYAVDDQGNLLGKLPPEPPAWKIFELRPFAVRTHKKYAAGLWIPRLGQRNVRRPAAYGILTNPKTRPPWTEVFLGQDGSRKTEAELRQAFHGRYDADDPAPLHVPLAPFAEPWRSPHVVDRAWPHHLVNRAGRHLFVVNKTAWMYFACKDPAGVVERARAQGVNVLRVALEGDLFREHLGWDLWPWRGSRQAPDWSGFDEAHWARVEERIRLAGERGMGFDVVLYTRLYPGAELAAAHQPYWKRVLMRLGGFANILTWEVANEYTGNEAFQDAAGRYLKAHDPFGRPVCTSDGTTDDAVWPHKDWIDLAVNHSCTSSTPRHGLREWYLAVARNTRAHGKPAFCNESGRETRHKNDDPAHRRKQGWLWCGSGAYWTLHSWEGCEGIDDPEYRAPGQEFIKPMSEFFGALPFWTLAPNETVVAVDGLDVICVALADPARETVLAYLCTPQTGRTVTGLKARLSLPDGRYALEYVEPATNTVRGAGEVAAAGLGRPQDLPIPEFTDDLAVRLRRREAAARTPMAGTG